MADNVTIKLDTLKLDALILVLPDRASEIIRTATFDLEADIKLSISGPSPSAPGDPPGVVTGNLLNSINSEVSDVQGVVNVGADYGIDLEFGTRKMAARPFVQPAVDRLSDNFDSYFDGFFDD